ncbi:acyltransferase family protein [Colwellia sp. PAMC 21821]|uniref:acyltransferase family protein n=1 Tax=Colwellia sp. PAMC 21821 TaxID=1816219 RepID=UPI0009BFA820
MLTANPMRFYYMDAMRSVLMMLGIFIHSSQVYSPNKNWLVFSDTTHPFFSYFITFIHSFRMPAFFIISGFFCLMMLQRQTVRAFISSKLQRILVPLLVTIFILNLLQSFILSTVNQQLFSFYDFFISGNWLSHLWFLINLLLYFLVSGIVCYLFSDSIKKICHKFTVLEKPPIEILMLLLPLCSIAIVGLNKIGFPLYSTYFNAIDMYQVISYLPYFIFGVLLFNSPKLLEKFSSANIFSLFTLLTIAYTLRFVVNFDSLFINDLLRVYSQSLIAWLSSSIIFKIFYLFANTPSKMWLFLSNSSYSVYLFHNIIVVLIALILVKYDIDLFLGFVILITSTITITLVIHMRVVLKFKLMQLLFNGK